MLLSKSCGYALKLLGSISSTTQFTKIHDISDKLELPYTSLAIIVQKLHKAKFIRSKKGKHGGICLARPPKQIMLIEVIESIDGDHLELCCLHHEKCDSSDPCILHSEIGVYKMKIIDLYKTTSIAQIN